MSMPIKDGEPVSVLQRAATPLDQRRAILRSGGSLRVSFSDLSKHWNQQEAAANDADEPPENATLRLACTSDAHLELAVDQVEARLLEAPAELPQAPPRLVHHLFGRFQFDVSDYNRAKAAKQGKSELYVAKEVPKHIDAAQHGTPSEPPMEGHREQNKVLPDPAFFERKMSYINRTQDSFNRRKEEKNRRQEAIHAKEDDLLTMELVRRDNQFYDTENPFCSVPGSHISNEFVGLILRIRMFPKAYSNVRMGQEKQDLRPAPIPLRLGQAEGPLMVTVDHCWVCRDSQALLFLRRHSMNIAYNNRKEHFWLTLLTSLHSRLGAGESCMMKQLVLSKKTGAEKYNGNQLHLIQTILNKAWTLVVPDDVQSVEEAIRTCKDGTKVVIKEGYYSWSRPVEVRNRIEVEGEEGEFLCTDLAEMDSGHGAFHNITFISSCGKGVHVSGGRWNFSDCIFQGYGDGCSVLSCGGDSEILINKCMICGLTTQQDVLRPLCCFSAFDRSEVKLSATVIKDASGSGLRVSGNAKVECIECQIRDNCLSALKIDQFCEVIVQNSVAFHNGSFLDSHYNPSISSYIDKTLGNCVQLYENIIYGKMWATRHRPAYLLGKHGSKISIDKGDIFAENQFFDDAFETPSASTLTGNEPLTSNYVLSSSWKVLTGKDLAPQYVLERERILSANKRLDGRVHMTE
eukprot:51040-Hanusia_phi.AAC.2